MTNPFVAISGPAGDLTSRQTWARAAGVAAASLLLGAATFFLQDILPDALTSFANSASGWTLLTVLLLTGVRVHPAMAALLGAVSFVLLTIGYSVAAELQGLVYDPTLFGLVGVAAGPFVGVATNWLRAVHSWQVAAGAALLSGIGVGEAVYGLTTVSDTTSPVYWVLIGAVSLALLVAMLVRRIRGVRWALLGVIGTCAVAGAFVVAFWSIGGV